MSTPFIKDSIFSIQYLSDLTPQALLTIGDLDQISLILSSQLELLKSSESVDNEEQIALLIQVIDRIYTQKVEIAINTYDLIDHHVKVISTISQSRDGLSELVKRKSLSNDHSLDKGSTYLQEIKGVAIPVRGRPRKYLSCSPVFSDHLEKSSKLPILYCTCRKEAYGDMIACDDPACAVEWYHYNCVGLTKKPRDKVTLYSIVFLKVANSYQYMSTLLQSYF